MSIDLPTRLYFRRFYCQPRPRSSKARQGPPPKNAVDAINRLRRIFASANQKCENERHRCAEPTSVSPRPSRLETGEATTEKPRGQPKRYPQQTQRLETVVENRASQGCEPGGLAPARPTEDPIAPRSASPKRKVESPRRTACHHPAPRCTHPTSFPRGSSKSRHSYIENSCQHVASAGSRPHPGRGRVPPVRNRP